MKINTVEVVNFRLLENIKISLDDKATLIVGRNNSGKTSLTEIFKKFLSNNAQFKYEDFSLNTYAKFKEALTLFDAYEKAKNSKTTGKDIETKEIKYKDAIPIISLNIYIDYEESDDLSSLSKFIMDLDPDRKDVLISCEYKVTYPEKLFKDFKLKAAKYDNDIIEFLRINYKSYYKDKIIAVDSQNRSNTIEINKTDIEDVFLPRFIDAQNKLDDQSTDRTKGLSKGFEDYYRLNNEDNTDIEKIELALVEVSKKLDGKYKDLFKGIFSDLKMFGVNSGINLQELNIKSHFEAKEIIKGNTQLFYNHDDNLLPEAHNGLGFSKLIFIILQFISFFEEYDKRKPKPDFQLIFIEEPEVHLHPQMQYVFIKNIIDFIESKKGWKVQIIITTHSSHIVAESGFERIRYFDNFTPTLNVRNLSEFKDVQDKADPSTVNFLKQYMSINKCDMFFADKIIMVEGTVERLLLPEMIKKDSEGLLSQYISIIEVGGAYAHKFNELLDFINVKTLVITDIDSIDTNNGRKACSVKDGDQTSNKTLISWMPKKKEIRELLDAKENDKIENKTRIAYQTIEEETKTCGRSFEEAFILTNANIFATNSKDISFKSIFQDKTKDNIISESYEIATKIQKKTDFAFDIMLLENWETPTYIKEGLLWLEP